MSLIIPRNSEHWFRRRRRGNSACFSLSELSRAQYLRQRLIRKRNLKKKNAVSFSVALAGKKEFGYLSLLLLLLLFSRRQILESLEVTWRTIVPLIKQQVYHVSSQPSNAPQEQSRHAKPFISHEHLPFILNSCTFKSKVKTISGKIKSHIHSEFIVHHQRG